MEMIDTETEVENLTPPKRISWAMRWAYAHPFVIYEVTDPELRSQMCCYRNEENRERDRQKMEKYLQTQDALAGYEETNA